MFTVVVIIRRQRRRQTFVIDDVQLIRQHLFVLSKHLLCYLVQQLSSFVRTVQVRRYIRVCTALDAVPSRRTDVRVRLSAVSRATRSHRFRGRSVRAHAITGSAARFILSCRCRHPHSTLQPNLFALVARFAVSYHGFYESFHLLSKLFNRIPRGVVRAL